MSNLLASDNQIQALLREASSAGDPETVRDCEAVLRGNRAARRRCSQVIENARAMAQE